MPRYSVGITLTPKVRAELGLPPAQQSNRSSGLLDTFDLSVTLPDETTCSVSYRRFGPASHRFSFEDPFVQHLWITDRMISDVPTITDKADELAVVAFSRAMIEEQKQMRRKSLPQGTVKPRSEEQLKVNTAEVCAGRYAVCLRLGSGRVTQIGKAYTDVQTPIAELLGDTFTHVKLFELQRLVIGICSRSRRCWIEPQFLPLPRECSCFSEGPDVEE